MFVEKREGNGELVMVVFGETLGRDGLGNFQLPGRLVIGLKTDDLPTDVGFTLMDQLPSGAGFFREDTVVFRRVADRNELSVEVTSVYDSHHWDGLFSLQATMHSRRRVIDASADYSLRYCHVDCDCWRISFDFTCSAENDLESVLEEVCDKVRWIEEKGNEQLLYGGW